ncbi:hypothetical protein Tco_1210630 [Tanacetum coccineum]
MLQSIPCSPECKIMGQILLDHPLSYALTTTADVLVVYLQQFWKTVSKVPNTKDIIKFKLDSQETTYTVDMFCDTLHLPVKTPNNPFVAPVNIEIIESFMQRVGYQGVVDKVSAFYMKFLAQPWQTMVKMFNRCLTTQTSGHDQTKINILQLFHFVVNRANVDYAALLWWDFINCLFQKKDVIQYPRLTKLIIADLKKKFPSIPQRINEDFHSIKDDIPLVSVYTKKNVQVRGMLILDAFLTKEIRATDDYTEWSKVIKMKNHMENLEHVDDDDENEEEKKYEKKYDKKQDEMGSLENRTEKMQTPIPTTPRSHRINLSSDKNIVQELTSALQDVQASRIYDQEHGTKIVVAVTVIQERDAFQYEVPTLISKEFNAQAPKIIEELFKMGDDFHSQRHDDHQEDNAPPEGEKRVKRHKTSKSSKSTKGLQRNPNEPPRYLYNKDLFFLKNGNTKEKKYILSLHNIHAKPFPKANLEEKMNR